MTNKQRDRVRNLTSSLIVALMCVITLLPIYIMIVLSLKSKTELMRANVFGLPEVAQWSNYVRAWKGGNFATYFLNSVYVSAVSVAGILLFSTMGAYAMTYFHFPGSSVVMTMVLFGLLVPGELTLIPQFLNMRTIGLSNTREALIILHVAGNLAFGIFLLRGFMKSVPKALIEAARIDGATEGKTLMSIVLPMIKPALTALLVLTFMWTWNNYFLARVYLLSDNVRTLPMGLDNFKAKNSQDMVLTAAATVMVAAPVIVFYLIFERKMVQGMVIGALKE